MNSGQRQPGIGKMGAALVKVVEEGLE
jgi:hypothetical protein